MARPWKKPTATRGEPRALSRSIVVTQAGIDRAVVSPALRGWMRRVKPSERYDTWHPEMMSSSADEWSWMVGGRLPGESRGARRVVCRTQLGPHGSSPIRWPQLPEPLVFRIRLNQSFDGHASQLGELRAGFQRRAPLLGASHLTDATRRGGHVPERANVAVVGETSTATVIEVAYCERFTNDDFLLYRACRLDRGAGVTSVLRGRTSRPMMVARVL